MNYIQSLQKNKKRKKQQQQQEQQENDITQNFVNKSWERCAYQGVIFRKILRDVVLVFFLLTLNIFHNFLFLFLILKKYL